MQGRSGTQPFSAIPADLSKSELQTPTAQGRTLAHAVFAWTLRALSGVLKASSGAAGPRFGASSAGIGKKDLPYKRNSKTTP